MRPKFLAVVLLSAIGLLIMMALVERGFGPRSVTPTAPNGDGFSTNQRDGSARSAGNAWAKVGSAGKLKRAISAPDLGTNGGDAAAAHEEYVQQRIDELDKLAREKSADSLNAILLELENPDVEIRKGALDATLQFRDRSSIPRLREIAASTTDPKEKAELLEAIEYLELPTLTERLAEPQANGANAKPPHNFSSFSNRFGRKPNAQTQGLLTKP